ncbi:MAG: YdcF family protein [Ethanoligenens sp.]
MEAKTAVSSIARNMVGLLLIATAIPNLGLKALTRFVPLFVVTGIIMIALPILLELPGQQFQKRGRRVLRGVSIACLVIFGGLIIESCAIVFGGLGQQPPEDATVVVLGEGMYGDQPSTNLMLSIEKAGDYLQAHPHAVCVASGGMRGTTTTEARAMREVLISNYGIRSSRIILEDRSQTTFENMKYSAAIIQKKGLSKNIALITPNYHMLRAKILADRQGLYPYGVPAATHLQWQWRAYLRALFALPKSLLFDL